MKTFPIKDLVVGDLVRWGELGSWWLITAVEVSPNENIYVTFNNGASRTTISHSPLGTYEGMEVFVIRDGEQIFP